MSWGFPLPVRVGKQFYITILLEKTYSSQPIHYQIYYRTMDPFEKVLGPGCVAVRFGGSK